MTLRRDEYVPVTSVLSELEEVLRSSPVLDAVTFSGSGEPTLHAGIGRVIRFIKERFPSYRLVLLTNGSLFYESGLRRDLFPLDLVIPSLDAASERVFRSINRPAEGYSFENYLYGLEAFSREYLGKIWLEIFIIPGLNDVKDEIQRFRKIIEKLQPERVQLNTLDRPGTEPWVRPASLKRLEAFRNLLGFQPCDILTRRFQGKNCRRTAAEEKPCCEENPQEKSGLAFRKRIVDVLTRRPSTAADLSLSLGLREMEILEYLDGLIKEGVVREERQLHEIFYSARPRSGR